MQCVTASNHPPICYSDVVSLSKEDDSYIGCGSVEIDDYVFSSQGVIWKGNHRQRSAMYWDYGQVSSCQYGVMDVTT